MNHKYIWKGNCSCKVHLFTLTVWFDVWLRNKNVTMIKWLCTSPVVLKEWHSQKFQCISNQVCIKPHIKIMIHWCSSVQPFMNSIWSDGQDIVVTLILYDQLDYSMPVKSLQYKLWTKITIQKGVYVSAVVDTFQAFYFRFARYTHQRISVKFKVRETLSVVVSVLLTHSHEN